MAFLVTAIRKVEREIYNDVFWKGGQVVEVKPAPIIAFFEVEVALASDKIIFEAELRRSKDDMMQVDWDEELVHLLFEHSRYKDKISKRTKRKDNEWILCEAIIDINENKPVEFPILINTN